MRWMPMRPASYGRCRAHRLRPSCCTAPTSPHAYAASQGRSPEDRASAVPDAARATAWPTRRRRGRNGLSTANSASGSVSARSEDRHLHARRRRTPPSRPSMPQVRKSIPSAASCVVERWRPYHPERKAKVRAGRLADYGRQHELSEHDYGKCRGLTGLE